MRKSPIWPFDAEMTSNGGQKGGAQGTTKFMKCWQQHKCLEMSILV